MKRCVLSSQPADQSDPERDCGPSGRGSAEPRDSSTRAEHPLKVLTRVERRRERLSWSKLQHRMEAADANGARVT
jgi:hypothetical protein